MSAHSPARQRGRSRRTQAQRSAATREALLDATIDCLVEHGYAETSTTIVCRRAGVSRGAQVHHFPTKADLVASALEHLARRREDEFRRHFANCATGRDLEAVILALWSGFEGPLFIAATELWTAARTDEDLRNRLRPIERGIGRVIWEFLYETLPEEIVERPNFERNFQAVLNMMRGLGITAEIREGPAPVDGLLAIAVELLEGPAPRA